MAMRRKQQKNPKPCKICGKPTIMQLIPSYGSYYICNDCFPDYRKKNEDDGYMTEADYQTWGRLL